MADNSTTWEWTLDDKISGELRSIMQRVERLETQLEGTSAKTD